MPDVALPPIPAPRGVTKRVEEAEAVAFLLDLKTLRYLLPFLGRQHTVSEVAPQVGLSSNSLLYRVHILRTLELLEVARLEPRQGRPVKVYRSTADSFFIPFSATDAETPADLFVAWEAPWGRLLAESMVRAVLGPVVQPDAPWGIQIYREGEEPEGIPASSSYPSRTSRSTSPTPPTWSLWAATSPGCGSTTRTRGRFNGNSSPWFSATRTAKGEHPIWYGSAWCPSLKKPHFRPCRSFEPLGEGEN